MPAQLTWDHAEHIGRQLQEEHPELDPMSVAFPELLAYVASLEKFVDDTEDVDHSTLANVHAAWHNEYKKAQNDDK